MFITLQQTDDTSVTFNVLEIDWVREEKEYLRRCILSCQGKLFNIKESYPELVGQLKGMTAHGQR